jgi:hypothetical protein
MSGRWLGLFFLLCLGLVGLGLIIGWSLNSILYVLTSGLICLLSIALIRLLKVGLGEGLWDSIFKALASIRDYSRKGTNIHAVVDQSSKPLYFTVDPENEHDSRRLQELVDGLSRRFKGLYAYDTEDKEVFRVLTYL